MQEKSVYDPYRNCQSWEEYQWQPDGSYELVRFWNYGYDPYKYTVEPKKPETEYYSPEYKQSGAEYYKGEPSLWDKIVFWYMVICVIAWIFS